MAVMVAGMGCSGHIFWLIDACQHHDARSGERDLGTTASCSLSLSSTRPLTGCGSHLIDSSNSSRVAGDRLEKAIFNMAP